MNKIRFNWLTKNPKFGNYTLLKQFVQSLFQTENKELAKLNYIFTNDVFLLNLNQTHLNHNTLTDIITFELSETTETIGEIYISIERVADNANKFNVAFKQEFLRVVFHGALHLCGYKDKKPADKLIMREKEDFYIKLYEKNH